MPEPSYVFSDTQKEPERERLEAIQAVFDPMTCHNLGRLGVRAGWICLEVGPGAGSIMEWLCDRVGSSGQVLAVDLDPRFVEAVNRPNLEVRRLDIATTPLDAARFDLIHARFVLMHIRDRQAALANLWQALKPGGWLLIEDPDFATARASVADPLETATPEAAILDRVFAATCQLYRAIGIDPYLGRQLPAIFQTMHLRNLDTHTEAAMLRGGTLRAKVWRMAAAHLKQPLIDTGLASATDISCFIDLMDNTATWAMDYCTIATWGQKPD